MTVGRQTGKSSISQFHKLWADIFKDRPIEDLILEERRIHGCVYHTVEPKGGKWSDMEDWAKQTFGEPGEIWPTQDFMWPEAPRWVQNNRKFWFRNIKDRDWFVMRWRS